MLVCIAAVAMAGGCGDDGAGTSADAAMGDAVATNDSSSPPDACSPDSASDVCGDGLDNDCNGMADDGCPAAGSLVWAKRAGGMVQDQKAWAVEVAPDGRAIVVGTHRGPAVFGPGESNQIMLDSEPTVIAPVGFAASYGSDGQLTWAQRVAVMMGVSGQVHLRAVDVAPDGGYAVAGYFDEAIVIAPDDDEPSPSGGTTGMRAFAALFDAAGDLKWTSFVNRQYGVWARDVAITDNGDIVVAGYLHGTTVFDPGGPNETTVADETTSNGYIAWWDASGAFLRVHLVHSEYSTEGLTIARRSGGGVIVGGEIAGPATLGEGMDAIELDTSYRATYLAAYDAAGQLLWGRTASDGNVEAWGMTQRADGTIYLTGSFATGTTFGPGQANEVALPNNISGAFVAQFTPDGQFEWVRTASQDFGQTLAMEAAPAPGAGVVITGRMDGTVTFNSGLSDETTVSANGLREIFVARYDQSGGLAWVSSVTGSGSYNIGNGIAVRPDGIIIVAGQFGSVATFGPGEPGETVLTSDGTDDIFVAAFAP